MFEHRPIDPSRRQALRRLACWPLLPWLGACGGDGPLVVASHAWPGHELIFLARREGWLPGERIRLQETASATRSIAALGRGQAQAAALTLDEVLRARSEGIALTAVLVFAISAGADVVLARPEIGHPEELRGKTVGAETTALGALIVAKLLARAGLEPADVRLRPILPEGHLDAWRSGELDALVTYEPTASRLLEQGARRLLDSRQFPDTIFDVLAVRAGALAGREDALKTLIAAHFRGLRRLRQNPQDTAYRIAGHLGLPGDEVIRAFRGLQLPGAARNRSLLAPAGRLHAAGRELSGLLLGSGLLPRGDPLTELVSDAYLPDAETA